MLAEQSARNNAVAVRLVKLSEFTTAKYLGILIDIHEHLSKPPERLVVGFFHAYRRDDLDANALVHEVLESLMDRCVALSCAMVYVVDDFLAGKHTLLRNALFVESVQLAGLDEIAQAENRHEAMLTVECVELRLGVVKVPVCSSRLQAPGG